MNLEEVSKLGATPIPGGSPGGAGIRYEPEFQKLQGEIDKLESVTGIPVNWREAGAFASEILRERSKDILVSSYLAMALLQEAGYPGLAAGLTVFRDLLSSFWEALFPLMEKMRAREAAVRWLDERLSKAVSARPAASENDREPLATSSVRLVEIDAFLKAKFPQGGPPFSDLPRAVREKIESIPPPPSSEAQPQAQPEPAVPKQAPAEIDSVEKAREAVQKAAVFLRRANPRDPIPYRLLRSVLWCDVVKLPQDKDSITPLAGGDMSFLGTLEDFLKHGEFQAVLDQAESRLPGNPLWLDLNFLSVRAMEGLGAEYSVTRQTVTEDVRSLIVRLPGLPALQFAGGIPFASARTRIWLENEVIGPPAPPPGTRGKLEEAAREARKLVARRQLPAATALFQKEMQGVTPGRERFLCRLELAKLCMEAGEHRLALPLFESLDEEGKRYLLEDWEPGLSVEVVKLLWQCYSALPKVEGAPEKAAQVYARLCRLDLSAAMALDGKPLERSK